MKTAVDMIEGPEAWTRFQAGMKKALAVPRVEIERRIEEHRAESAKNPNRRGPKPKRKHGAGHEPSV